MKNGDHCIKFVTAAEDHRNGIHVLVERKQKGLGLYSSCRKRNSDGGGTNPVHFIGCIFFHRDIYKQSAGNDDGDDVKQ